MQRFSLLNRLSLSHFSFARINHCFVRLKSKQDKSSSKQNDYSKTLNLPNPGKFELSMKKICDLEENIKKLADFDGLYEWQLKHREGRPEYVLHDGPPYANGDIHIGHMVNKVLKDIYLRYKLLAGHRINYVPGWDCHGLPIELNAVKALNDKKKKREGGKATPVEVRNNARSFANKCIETQMNSFKQMNLLVDWRRVYRTIDAEFMCNEIDLFYELYEKKLIYRDYMPVYWSVSSQTALAEFELEYNPAHKSDALYVQFQLAHFPDAIKNKLSTSQKLYAPIWTTTPWSLPCNKAIAYNNSLKYGVLSVESEDKAYLIANDLIESVKETIPQLKEARRIECLIDGASLSGSLYKSPFLDDLLLPLLPSDHVGSKQGTGLVHIAPALGQDDFKIGIRHQLPTECVIDELGKYTHHDPVLNRFSLSGKAVLDPQTIACIKHILRPAILHEHAHLHSYPYDWRTKKPCIIRSSMQWFIDTNRLKEAALEKLKRVKIRPETASGSMNASIQSRPYWCISRQRSWGLPIPCFYQTDLNNKQTPLVNKSFIEELKNLIRQEGNVDFWWSNKHDTQLLQSQNQSSNLTKSMDIFDIWFDSGSTFNTILNKSQADLYCEGVDQFSGWFQSSLLLSVALNQQSPYKSILVHGFVVDEANRKMSKSVGNVIEPRQAIRGVPNKLPQCGLDVLRFWTAHEHHKPQLQIGPAILEKFLKRTFDLRSILRFIVGNLSDFNEEGLLEYEQLWPIDKFILNRLNEVVESVVGSYEDMSINKSILQLESFFLTQLSSFYIKSIRDRLYCEAKESLERRSAQTALFHLLEKCLVLLAPIMPHLSEEAFFYSILKRRNAESSLFRSELNYEVNKEWRNEEIDELFNVLGKIRDEFYERVPSNSGSHKLSIECDEELFRLIERFGARSQYWLEEIFACARVQIKLSHKSDLKKIHVNEKKFSYLIEAEKVSDKFACGRCRRLASEAENQLCDRCVKVLIN